MPPRKGKRWVWCPTHSKSAGAATAEPIPVSAMAAPAAPVRPWARTSPRIPRVAPARAMATQAAPAYRPNTGMTGQGEIENFSEKSVPVALDMSATTPRKTGR